MRVSMFLFSNFGFVSLSHTTKKKNTWSFVDIYMCELKFTRLTKQDMPFDTHMFRQQTCAHIDLVKTHALARLSPAQDRRMVQRLIFLLQ